MTRIVPCRCTDRTQLCRAARPDAATTSRLIEEVNADEGVRWLFSFLSADRRRSYCLYEAPSPDEIVTAAERASVPLDKIAEVDKFDPKLMSQTPFRPQSLLGY